MLNYDRFDAIFSWKIPPEYFSELYGKIVKYNKIDDWYIWANMFKGKYSMTTFHSLDAYWPGLQVI